MDAHTDQSFVPVHDAPLGSGAAGWFTGRAGAPSDASIRTDAAGGTATGRALDRRVPGHPSNLSHLRPHRPGDLARARAAVGRSTGTDPAAWHLMRQVHGDRVAVVDAQTPLGAQLCDVDAVVTDQPGRVLGVSVADCVPVLLAGPRSVAAVHAGRAGVMLGVVRAAVEAMVALGEHVEQVHAALGPAIGGCCYEVPASLRDEVAAVVPVTVDETTWGAPSLDLRAGVASQLATCGVRRVASVGECTSCDPDAAWFSHRVDAASGRQLGLVVRHETLRPVASS